MCHPFRRHKKLTLTYFPFRSPPQQICALKSYLLDMPLDCFQYLMRFIARDFDYHETVNEFLRLRLTNRVLFGHNRRALYLTRIRDDECRSIANTRNTVILPVVL
jgi:hypothetical protein